MSAWERTGAPAELYARARYGRTGKQTASGKGNPDAACVTLAAGAGGRAAAYWSVAGVQTSNGTRSGGLRGSQRPPAPARGLNLRRRTIRLGALIVLRKPVALPNSPVCDAYYRDRQDPLSLPYVSAARPTAGKIVSNVSKRHKMQKTECSVPTEGTIANSKNQTG